MATNLKQILGQITGAKKKPALDFKVGEGLTPEQKIKAEQIVRKPAPVLNNKQSSAYWGNLIKTEFTPRTNAVPIRRLFAKEPTLTKAPPIATQLGGLGFRLIEAVPKAVATIGGELKAGFKPTTVKSNIDLRRFGFDKPNYVTASKEVTDRINKGENPFIAGLNVLSNKSLDVAFGASLFGDLAKLSTSILLSGGPEAKIEAQNVIDAFKSKQKEVFARLKNAPLDVREKALADISNAKTQAEKVLKKLGKPNSFDRARVSASRYTELIGRQTEVKDLGNFLNPDINLKTPKITPAPIGTKQLPGTRDVNNTQPFGLSIKKVENVGKSETEPLIKEAKKYKTADEFVEKNIDNYIKTTKEYKDWAKGSSKIIEAYHGTPYSFDKFEIGKKQAGAYDIDGISFAPEKRLAEPFSRQYPDWYYSKKKIINKKYPEVFEIKDKIKQLENNKKIRSVEAIKKRRKPIYNTIKKRWEDEKDWLFNNNFEKFKEEYTFLFDELKKLDKELERAKAKTDINITTKEKKILESYNKELQKLNDSVKGNIYKVYIKGNNIIDEIGEDLGFSSFRDHALAELRGDILRIKDADTGQYIGEEIMVNDPSQVFIVNSPKNISKLKEIWEKANKPVLPKIKNQSLITEAKKYKSADEFIKAHRKKIQLEKINKLNPIKDNFHTGIRSIDDIKTFKEAIKDPESFVYPDFNKETAEKATKDGKITIYSSKPLDKELAQFVSPSKMNATDYAGGNTVYSKNVNIDDVAWINVDEGQLVGKTKPQLTDIWNKANKITPETNLIKEAKKYKTADEFTNSLFKEGSTPSRNSSKLIELTKNGKKVKSQTLTLLRGTSNISKENPKGGLWFTENVSEAKTYGDNIYVAKVKLGKTRTFDDVEDAYFSLTGKELTQKQIDGGQRVVEPLLKKEAQKQGLDSLVLKYGGVGDGAGQNPQVVIFNNKLIISKAKLNDIWEKENKKELPKIATQKTTTGAKTKKTIIEQTTQKPETSFTQRIKDLARGAREATTLTKTQIKATQNELTNIIKESKLGLADKGKFLSSVKNVQTPEQLNKIIPEVETRITKLEEASTKRNLLSQIKKELKAPITKKVGSNKISKYSPKTTKLLKEYKTGTTLLSPEGLKIKKLQTTADWYEKHPNEYLPESVVKELEDLNKKNLKSLTIPELKTELKNIQSIKSQGKTFQRITRDREIIQRIQNIDKFNEIIDADNVDKAIVPETKNIIQRALTKAKVFNLNLLNSDTLFDTLDETSKAKLNSGEIHSFFQNAVNKSRDLEIILNKKDLKNTQELLNKYEIGKELNKKETFDINGKPTKLTRNSMMEIYLATFDKAKLNSVIVGNKIPEKVISKIISKLTKNEKALVEDILKYHSDKYPEINEVFKKVNFMDMPKNEGYSPMHKDLKFTKDNEINIAKDNLQYAKASVKKGSTIERSGSLAPIKLDFIGNLVNDISQANHYISWELPIKEINSTLSGIKDSIVSKYGNEYYDVLREWVKKVAGDGRYDTTVLARELLRLRRGITKSLITNFITPLKQTISLSSFLTEINELDLSKGVSKYILHKKQWDNFWSNVPQIANRSETLTRDIGAVSKSRSALKKLKGKKPISEVGVAPVRLFDKLTVRSGATAVYLKAIKDGLSEDEAIKKTIGVVRRTQITGDIKDLVGFQSGGALEKLLTMFQNQPNKYYNIIYQNIRAYAKGRNTKMGLARALLYAWIIPTFLYEEFSTGGKAKPKDLLLSEILGPANYVLILGNLIQSAKSGFSYSASPIEDIAKNLTDSMKDIIKGDILKSMETLGELALKTQGVPVNQPKRTYKGIQDMITGKTSDWRRLIWSKYSLNETKYSPIKATYEKAQKLKAEGKDKEAQALVDSLSEAGYKLYKEYKSSLKAKETKQGKIDILPKYKEIQKVNKTDPQKAQDMVNALTDNEYKYYQLVKKSKQKDELSKQPIFK